MGRKMNERTLQMLQNFMTLHNNGWTIPEIAKKYDLASRTIYSYLDKIADENGVTRDSLLSVPHTEHLCYERQFEPVKPVDLTEFKQRFQKTLDAMNDVTEIIELILDEQEGEL